MKNKLLLCSLAFVGMQAMNNLSAQNCQAGFTYSVNNNVVTFTNTSTGASVPAYFWNFGDGNYDWQTNPTHTYMSNGTYNVCLSMMDSSGLSSCQSMICDSVVITNAPNMCAVSITGNTNIPSGASTVLTASGGTTYLWSNGTTTASITVAPTVTTSYSVTACSANGCCATGVVTVFVTPNTVCNLQAGFTFNSTNDPQVTFTNTSTNVNVIQSIYGWNFGDGNYDVQANTTHTYMYNGGYLVCLTVYDTINNCSDTYCDTLMIINASSNPCSISVAASGTNPSSATANDGSVSVAISGGTAPYTYLWLLGGQTTQTVVGLSNGCYVIIITDAAGCSAHDSVCISSSTAGGTCSANIYLYPDSNNNSVWYAYPVVTGVAPFTYFWDFGDGTNSTQQYPTHTYAVAGNYMICLTITDANQCSSTSCDTTYKLVSANSMLTLIVASPLTGIQENTVSVNSVFPNPSNDMIEVSLSQLTQGEITITDMIGREVYQEKINTNNARVNVSTLPVGCYTLSIISGTKTIREKIMIAR
ncbi:MAG: PKD domain-containing protein [Bacteroidota bacterium]